MEWTNLQDLEEREKKETQPDEEPLFLKGSNNS